ncbi:phosphogluconate dehydratase [Dongshaea marina]|uniref:phosphogluconate dehydratase n=1 Tax=Dongshaea marina TaxID=2047966 RepID=UPI000D3E91CB|nr:phosphogluconate dehydratase [Dongshaea marina]
MNPIICQVTDRITERSTRTRSHYLEVIREQANQGVPRATLSCGNLAHTAAACSSAQKSSLLDMTRVNVGIISAYNDMLSAHQPYADYPRQIKQILSRLGHSAQVAAGVPAMCDGVTQGQPGMDLSLFSRDLIAQATAIGLSHNTFDATLLLGICDKIAPGQLMGALAFGHLPAAFVPAGPMGSGISNSEKVSIRQQYAAGEVNKQALLEMECRAYHSPGTCTFYGTANTNQLVFEVMGLMLPGSAFVPPDTELREALTAKIASHMVRIARGSGDYRPLAEVVDARCLVNGLVALLASGGSTNHSIHMLAIARAAGLIVTWDDLDALSQVVPLLTRLYPNGPEDINAFEAAGGVPTLMLELARRGLLHMDATPVYGTMEDYLQSPEIDAGELVYRPAVSSANPKVIAAAGEIFSEQGGLKLVQGNLGRGVIKVSAIAKQHQQLEAPALVFESQHEVERAYQAGEINQDAVIVVRHNGPAANGMPELHKLMPILGNLMQQGFKVALVTDGRLSGASGKVPAVIHMTPEASRGGPLARLENGDRIRLDAGEGSLEVLTDISSREDTLVELSYQHVGGGRELFSVYRHNISSAESGATILYQEES